MSTAGAYSPKEIIAFERAILKTLKWRVNFPTLAFWANNISYKWDDFVNFFASHFAYDINFKSLQLPTFRERTNEDYVFFRNMFQILDNITLDIEYLQYSEKFLVLAVIYLFVGIYLRYFTITDVFNEFCKDIHCYTNFYDLNIIFNRFLNNYIICELDDIVEHIYYVSQFFVIEFDYSPVRSLHDEHDSPV
jgi:hypothetical protein